MTQSSPTLAMTLSLLIKWSDALIRHQATNGVDRGGIFCPACQFVHGRCGDAVYPFLTLFERTDDEKYRQAARDVFDWSERRVSQPDGSWKNEVSVNDWKGITCFSLIALGEALRLHGDRLTDAERLRWRDRLRRGADFLFSYITFDIGDINYPLSSAASLAICGEVLGEQRYTARARELAHFGLQHQTVNGLVWGEGPRGAGDFSPRGLRPIDVPYNVEESLPNLALYCELTGDEMAREVVIASLQAHLRWMLPDGAWDAGWCSRQYKWTYWGSRTSDGCASGYLLLREHDPRFSEAAARNLALLRACTHDGLLYGGPHLHARRIPACIHHTFAHAKGLAAALDSGAADAAASADLPNDTPFGVREWSEAGVFQIGRYSWRASITVNDLPSTPKRGGYPSGGALSLLWHTEAGPLCAASMNDYTLYESSNMQKAASDFESFCLTPRVEMRVGDMLYSNLYDRRARALVSGDANSAKARITGYLVNRSGESPTNGAATVEIPFEFIYRFDREALTVEVGVSLSESPVRFILPIVSEQKEAAFWHQDALEIQKPRARVRLTANKPPESCNTQRVFNFVPGFEAIPATFALTGGEILRLRLTVSGD